MPREKAQETQSVAELQDGSWMLRAGHSTAGLPEPWWELHVETGVCALSENAPAGVNPSE